MQNDCYMYNCKSNQKALDSESSCTWAQTPLAPEVRNNKFNALFL